MKNNEELDSVMNFRINSKVKEKFKYLAKVKGYKNLSEYMKYLVMKDISESEFKSLYVPDEVN